MDKIHTIELDNAEHKQLSGGKLSFCNSYKFWSYLVLIIGFSISILAGLFSYHYYEEKEHSRLELASNEIVTLVQNRMVAYEQILKSGVALFNASENVSRNKWAIFVKEHKLNENFKGIQGFAYSEIVLPQYKQPEEERIKKEGFSEYAIKPEGQRELYAPVIYIEPFDERNKRAFGYDVFSEKVRREAMIKAIEYGKAVITGKVKLVQENDKDVQPGFLMYLPVYKKDFKLDTPKDRTLAIQGFVSAVFRTNDLLNNIFETMFSDIHFEIYDGTLPSKENILYDSNTNHHKYVKVYKTTNMTMNEHTWTLIFKTNSIFKSEYIYIIILIPSLILILTLLLYLLLNSLIKTKEITVQIAKKTTQKLYDSEEKYRAIFNGTLDGIVLADLTTKEFVDVNVTMCKMMGYTHEEFIKLNILDIHPEESLPYVLEQFEKMVKAELLFSTAIPFKRKDGSIFSADVNAARLNLGGKDYLMGVFRDITERQRAEKALHDSEEIMLTQSKQAAMGEMISMIAHQWRQPLNIIGLAVANIQTKQALDILDEKSIEDNTVIIADNITFMSDTIDDFRNYFKSDAPKEYTKVEEIIDIVFKIIGKNLENNQISFNVENNSKSSLFIHKNSFVQVLINIVSNAKDALISNNVIGASINITVNETQDSVVLSVCDNAGGIADDIIDKIHEPYFSTKALTGTGLGLYISHTIVEKHLFGTFTWRNKDEGACFMISLNIKQNTKE